MAIMPATIGSDVLDGGGVELTLQQGASIGIAAGQQKTPYPVLTPLELDQFFTY